MTTIVVDHNLEGHAVLLWGTLAAEGWFDLLSLHVVTFRDVGLPFDTNDRLLWRFAQARQLIILTANRNMRGSDSLEQTIREENTHSSLPVITVGDGNRLEEKRYREACAIRLAEIVLELDNYLGAGRLYIP